MAVPEQRPMHGLLPCELLDGQQEGNILLVFPLELRPDAARRRLKDERSVPFGAGCSDEALTGFYGLAGDDEHRPADELVRTTVPDTLARRPWSVPAAMSGTGFAAAASATSFPFIKLRLAQENSPLWSRAYSPAASFSCVTAFPGKALPPTGRRRPAPAGRASGPPARRTRQSPAARAAEGERQGIRPRAPVAGEGDGCKRKAPAVFGCAAAPAVCGPERPVSDNAMRRTGPRTRRAGERCRRGAAACGRSSQQTFGIAVLRRKGDACPELNPFHGRKLLFL